jgi:hypothetical protein
MVSDMNPSKNRANFGGGAKKTDKIVVMATGGPNLRQALAQILMTAR